MRVVITGGTGLIGRALSRELAADDHEVVVLSRDPGRHATTIPEDVRVEAWDARSAAGWGALADGAGAIVNLAGEGLADGRWTDARKQRIRNSRVDATAAVTEAVGAAGSKPPVVVQGSAVGFYGPRGVEEVDEDTPSGDDFAARVCIATERAAEPMRDMGVRVPVIRTGVVLSREGGALPRMARPFKFFAGGPIGSGAQFLPWIHLEDMVAALRFLIDDQRADGPYNLTAPEPVTSTQFGQAMGRVLHRPSAIPAPSFALKAVFGEMSSVLLSGQRAIPKRLTQAGFRFSYPDLEPALADLLG